MAKEISGYIKLQIMGGQANPAPPVGPALGQRGINIMEFCKAFNDKTKAFAGKPIPVVITVYKDKKLEIYASNLCTEIMLPSNDDWSFVCCLSSINLLHYDKWKDTDAVETLTYFLDAVMEEFITKLEAVSYTHLTLPTIYSV